MIAGTICYEVHSGLGHLARSFHGAGLLQRMYVVRHPHYPAQQFYPPESRYERGRETEFLEGLDVLLLFETAVGSNWPLVKRAKRQGVKVVLMVNHEWTPFPPPVQPDLVWCPSPLDLEYYGKDYPCWEEFAPVEVPWRLRERALTFVHNAGHGQHEYSKGTPQVLEAMRHVKSPVKLIVRGQPAEPRMRELLDKASDDPRVEVVAKEDLTADDLWGVGDVFINAEQWNGMSLMLQEARAAGMLVITTDRYPANSWLPKEPLIPVDHYEDWAIATKFKRAIVTPQAIAAKIDEWYNRDITEYSLSGKEWGERHNWNALRPRFVEMMESVTNGK